MKGFVRRAAVLLGSAALALGGAGCYTTDDHQTLRDYYDPCYPERYNDMARSEVNADFAPQVLNGEILDQTVWAWFFDPGTDKLNPAGLEQLAYIARRRPTPDLHVFVQTAKTDEIGGYDPDKPNAMTEARNTLDAKRVAAVEKFLLAQTAGRGIPFQVAIHDPAEVGLPAIGVNRAQQEMLNTRFKGGLSSGGASAGGGAGTGLGGGGGGGAGGAGGGSGTPR
jgi:uncharacterized membrane protein YgcG